MKMLGIKELKTKIEITDTTVECPVKDCSKKVERQRVGFKKEDRFKCPQHNIYISPSTFEYQSELDNLLWKDKADLDLFKKIKAVKRESRIARDNSEDAVSWNVFRFLERNNLICEFLQKVAGLYENSAEVIYWSYSQSQQNLWDMLNKGRKEFELVPSKGSEPDIIILGNKTLVIIEAKLGADNKTTPSKLYVEDKYVSGAQGWWEKVFYSDFKTVAIKNKKYELSRFWLIGSWIANKLNLDFYLINLTLSNQEKNIEQIFKKHIMEDNSRIFKRITWEQIYEYISNSNFSGHDKGNMTKYFKNKSIGYDSNGNLQRAFSTM
jgi:hypothetical protein